MRAPSPAAPCAAARAAVGTLVLGLLASACGSVGPLGPRRMTFATVQTLNPGVDGRWILDEFPEATVERGPDGRLRRLSYAVEDPQAKSQRVTLHLDANEVLARKEYSGGLVRPDTPDPDAARYTAAPGGRSVGKSR